VIRPPLPGRGHSTDVPTGRHAYRPSPGPRGATSEQTPPADAAASGLGATDLPLRWPRPPGGQRGGTAHPVDAGEPRLPAFTGDQSVPLASDAPRGDPEVFDTGHATALYPELAPLAGWSWSWVGTGTTAQLVGYHTIGAAVDLLYIDNDTHATLTRTDTAGVLYLHQSGELGAVLVMLALGEPS
jgi:hypothetical protein